MQERVICVNDQKDYILNSEYGVQLIENLDDTVCNKYHIYDYTYLICAFSDIFESAKDLYSSNPSFFFLRTISMLDLLALVQKIIDNPLLKVKVILVDYASYETAFKNQENFYSSDSCVNRSLIDLMTYCSRGQNRKSENMISNFFINLRDYYHMIRRAEDFLTFRDSIRDRLKITTIKISEGDKYE